MCGLGPEVEEATVESERGGEPREVAVPQVRRAPVQQPPQALRPNIRFPYIQFRKLFTPVPRRIYITVQITFCSLAVLVVHRSYSTY